MKLLLSLTLFLAVGLFSCQKVRNCECKTTWIEYTEYAHIPRENIIAYPVKGM